MKPKKIKRPRTINAPDDLWEEVQKTAHRLNVSVSQLTVDLLWEYIRANRKETPEATDPSAALRIRAYELAKSRMHSRNIVQAESAIRAAMHTCADDELTHDGINKLQLFTTAIEYLPMFEGGEGDEEA